MSNEGGLIAAGMSEFFRAGLSRLRIFSALARWKRPARRLRLGETLSLGAKGMVAVVKYQEQEFLLGCTNNTIAMLAELSSGAGSDGARRSELRREE